MTIRDKSGGPLLHAELEPALGSGPPVLLADNGNRSLEIDRSKAAQFYRLISATKTEVEALKKAGFKLECAEEFVARDG
jgi:hypothetical protein